MIDYRSKSRELDGLAQFSKDVNEAKSDWEGDSGCAHESRVIDRG